MRLLLAAPLAVAMVAAIPVVAAPAKRLTTAQLLAQAVAAPTRTAANLARDKYRHPAQTLAFFGLKPTDTVVELWPSGGWYTEILAPYVRAHGLLIAASPPGKAGERIETKMRADPKAYGAVVRGNFPALLGTPAIAPGSADVVLTFRNIHNWRMGEYAPTHADYSAAAFREIFAMLKPGGVLGVVEHHLPERADASRELTSGYIKLSTVRRLAEQAGFKFAGSSDINANPRDTHDYPKGVWTLPPNYAEGAVDRDRYTAIGESDRMTLKFVKPAR